VAEPITSPPNSGTGEKPLSPRWMPPSATTTAIGVPLRSGRPAFRYWRSPTSESVPAGPLVVLAANVRQSTSSSIRCASSASGRGTDPLHQGGHLLRGQAAAVGDPGDHLALERVDQPAGHLPVRRGEVLLGV